MFFEPIGMVTWHQNWEEQSFQGRVSQSFFTTSRLGLWELGHLLFHSQLGRRAGPLRYLAYSPKNFYVKWKLRRFYHHATSPRHPEIELKSCLDFSEKSAILCGESQRKPMPIGAKAFRTPPGSFWHRSWSIWYQILSKNVEEKTGGRNWNIHFD